MPFFLNLYFQAPKHPLAHVSMQIRTKPRTPSLMALGKRAGRMRNWFIPFQRDCLITKRDDESKTNEARAAYRSESSGIDSSYAACKKFVRGTMYNRLWLS